MNTFKTFQSPLSWRYGSEEMHEIFSEENKFKLWRKIWVALARAQNRAGLVNDSELSDLENNQNKIDIERILEIELETKHDVVAALREFAEKAKIGGGVIHLAATSQDILDNAETMRNKQALSIIESKLVKILHIFADKISQYADLPCMGYTHLQPAEPTTLGYRFAFYAQDLLLDLRLLRAIKTFIKGKGLKGAVGTQASYKELLKGNTTTAIQLEEQFLKDLQLEAVLISSQVNPRKFDFLLVSTLSSIASSLSKFAFDLRIMQSPGFGEWAEPFAEKQVGSSAMPFKKNPLNSEKICSLARFVNALPPVALENASVSLLERTLDDSANKRIIMPEAFITTDEILETGQKIVTGLIINEKKINHNLKVYAPFSATESIIIHAVKNGANRQDMHELLREISMKAWEKVENGEQNTMQSLVVKDSRINKYIDVNTIDELFDVRSHIGTAPERARMMSEIIKSEIK